jgi:D-alanyl-D-alanine dipeptidase
MVHIQKGEGQGTNERLTPEQLYKPIPEVSVDKWKEVEVDETDDRFKEKLVPLGPYTDFSDCDAWGVYYGERGEVGDRNMNFLMKPIDRDTTLLTHFVREGVLERLKVAQKMLPKDHYFIFYDTFRPLDVQQALFDGQLEALAKAHPDWNHEKLEMETQTYVSIPAPNRERGFTWPSPHSTAGVVDLSIIRLQPEGTQRLRELEMDKLAGNLDGPVSKDEEVARKEVIEWIESQGFSENERQIILNGWLKEYRYFHEKQRIFHQFSQDLNMGTIFDHFDDPEDPNPMTGTRHYEKREEDGENLSAADKEARQNRRMLYNIMTTAGFANYQGEWWHFSIGDNMWAKATGQQKAYYGGFPDLPDYCRVQEEARRGVYAQELTDFSTQQDELFTGEQAYDPTEIKE